jgi:hypothetical protein
MWLLTYLEPVVVLGFGTLGPNILYSSTISSVTFPLEHTK